MQQIWQTVHLGYLSATRSLLPASQLSLTSHNASCWRLLLAKRQLYHTFVMLWIILTECELQRVLLFHTKRCRVSVIELFIIEQKPKWNMHEGKWRHCVHCVNGSQRKSAQTYFVQFGHIQCHRASPKMSHKRISWMKSLLAGWHRARLVASPLLDASSQRENRSGRLGLQDSQIQVSFSWYFRIKLAQTSTVKLVASRLSSNFIHGCWLAKKLQR